MNGTIADQVIIKRVAVAIEGISFDEMTRAEKNICTALREAGWVNLEVEDGIKVVRLTPYGMKWAS